MISNGASNPHSSQLGTFNPVLAAKDLIRSFTGFYDQDVSVKYLPDLGDCLPSIELKSPIKSLIIDLYGETAREIAREMSTIFTNLKKVRPKSIKLRGLNKNASSDVEHDKKATDALLNEMHKVK